MHTDRIIIGSVTYATKAKKALEGVGINARIRKFDTYTKNGCHYGLEIPSGHLLTVAAVLRPLKIPYQVVS